MKPGQFDSLPTDATPRTRRRPAARSTGRWPRRRAARAASRWSAARPASARQRWSNGSRAAPGRRVLWGACDALLTPPARPLHDMAAQAGAEAPRASTPDAAARLFAAVLAEFGRGRPIAVVEDVHWADEATLDLLRFLGRRIRQAALLVLTYRDDELGPRHPLRGCWATWPPRPPCAACRCRRSRAAVRALVGGARSTRPRSTARPAAIRSSSPRRSPGRGAACRSPSATRCWPASRACRPRRTPFSGPPRRRPRSRAVAARRRWGGGGERRRGLLARRAGGAG